MTVTSPLAVSLAEASAVERALRAELGELRAQVAERNRTIVLLSEENAALRAQLGAMLERVAELERRVGQSPRNSDRPPSTEGYGKPAPRSRRRRTGRGPGGQPGHEGTTLCQVADPDRVVRHAPRRCPCGRSLRRAPVTSVEVRQVFDLPEIRLRVTEHRIEHRGCRCGRVTMAEPPAGVNAPSQYGPSMRALATYLLAGQHLPLGRTAELLAELLGAPVGEGSLTAWYTQAAAGLDDFEAAVRDRLAAADVLGADETGLRVDGRLHWLHTARTDELTLLTVSERRGVEGMREAAVLPALRPGTVLVHDCWAPYREFDVTHALCGAHLLRELTAAADVDGQGWATAMDRLLCEINSTVRAGRDAGADGLHPTLLATYRRRYAGIVEAGWAANPDHRPGQRGRRKRPKHVNLLDRLDAHRDEVLRFSGDFRVPFTNNGSERDIRPVKIRVKVAGGLRTITGAAAFARLRSYLSTAAKQGRSAFQVLRDLHDGNPWMPVTIPKTC
jgi:transposase